MMAVLKQYPPNFKMIHKKLSPPPGTIFCYGPIIYNPDGVHLDYPLIAHEEVHCRQQGESPDLWWRRYIADIPFRLSQEIPAYQIQYREGRKILKDRNKLAGWLSRLATELSGATYGNMMSYADAYKAISRDELYLF